ncbi:MAG: hypothetical protein F6J87_14330 [Spirulina sp. SIO3F2]|nr:hypothetical protein [Spirulina sp. SIO3F2]
MPFSVLLRLFASLWITYLFHFQPLAQGSDRLVFLVQAIAEQSTFALDDYTVLLPPDQGLVYRDHLYSDLNPGMALLAMPLWWIVQLFYRILPETAAIRDAQFHYVLSHAVATLSTTSVLTALTGCGLALVVYHKTQQQWRSLLAAFLYGGGSIACFFATHLNPNTAIAAVVLGIYLCLFTPQLLGLNEPQRRSAVLGALLGFGVLIDTTMLPMVWVTALFWFVQYRDRWQDLLWVILGAIVPLALLFYYQLACFGQPLITTAGILVAQTQGGTNPITWQTLLGLPLNLLVYQPYGLLTLLYLAVFWRRSHPLSILEKNFLVVTTVVMIGGVIYLLKLGAIPSDLLLERFGPQLLIPLLPLWCLVVALYCPRRLNGMALTLIGLGFWFNFVGIQQGIVPDEHVFRSSIMALPRLPAFPWFTWLKIVRSSLFGVELAGVQAGFFFMAWLVLLAVIWLPLGRGQSPFSVRRAQSPSGRVRR